MRKSRELHNMTANLSAQPTRHHSLKQIVHWFMLPTNTFIFFHVLHMSPCSLQTINLVLYYTRVHALHRRVQLYVYRMFVRVRAPLRPPHPAPSSLSPTTAAPHPPFSPPVPPCIGNGLNPDGRLLVTMVGGCFDMVDEPCDMLDVSCLDVSCDIVDGSCNMFDDSPKKCYDVSCDLVDGIFGTWLT